jgi:hypothetical protein
LEVKDFIQTVLLDEVCIMHANGVKMHTLSAVAHGIEVCGALLDDRPFKAKGLGRKRFQLAISKLFPKAYMQADASIDLYGQLRSHMSHSMLPGQLVQMNAASSHLVIIDGRLHLSLDAMVRDYLEALKALLGRHDAGELKPKRISF